LYFYTYLYSHYLYTDDTVIIQVNTLDLSLLLSRTLFLGLRNLTPGWRWGVNRSHPWDVLLQFVLEGLLFHMILNSRRFWSASAHRRIQRARASTLATNTWGHVPLLKHFHSPGCIRDFTPDGRRIVGEPLGSWFLWCRYLGIIGVLLSSCTLYSCEESVSVSNN